MTPAGKVYTLVRQESLNGMHSVEFLTHLGRVAGERLLVVWDGSPIHRRLEVKEFVAETRGKVWLEALPGYAPDLNPWDEGGWHHLKNVRCATRCAETSKNCTRSSTSPSVAYVGSRT
jgi:transposase